MVTINRALIPIKAHYFFFMAAMGPILPQINVFGKQLGISPDVMGLITCVLPILFLIAKPIVGFVADYFTVCRKFIFVLIIVIMTLCYAGFYFVPQPPEHTIDSQAKLSFNVTKDDLPSSSEYFTTDMHELLCTSTRLMNCKIQNATYKIYVQKGTFSNGTEEFGYRFLLSTPMQLFNFNSTIPTEMECLPDESALPDCLYNTATFWLFLVLMCLGTIGFNVANSISDAVCFDMLGESQEMKYGAQRVFGTIGFGISALIAGVAVDLSTNDAIKSFTPALIIMLVFSGLDVLSISKLNLPRLSTDSILRDVWTLLRRKEIIIFLIFVTIAGVVDSFVIYYMFWHLEEVAFKTGHMANIKLIEGCVVAAECLGGEILFFIVSGKILKRIGYVHCLSLCFFTYAVRLGLISLITNPWWLVVIEFFMQGCSYALSYTCIVAYASAVSPPGTSATIQGLVAGVDDGFGYAIGSLIGGQMYRYMGGTMSFQIFSLISMLACIAHIILRPASKHGPGTPQDGYSLPVEQEKAEKINLSK